MTDIACAECGKYFAQKVGLRPMKFCGAECRNRHHKRNPPTGPYTKEANCDVCGKPYIRTRRNQRFCCRSCYSRAWFLFHRQQVLDKAVLRAAKFRREHPDIARRREEQTRAKDKVSKPWKNCLASTRLRARTFLITFDLNNDWARKHWTGKCAITGIRFENGKKGRGPNPRSASIDRIDPVLGYTQANSRFIIFACNALKGRGTDEEMFELAKAIAAASK